QIKKLEEDLKKKKKKKKGPKPQKEKGWREDYAWVREQIEGKKKEKVEQTTKRKKDVKEEKIPKKRTVSWSEVMEDTSSEKKKSKKKKKKKKKKAKEEKREVLYMMKGLTYEDFAENIGLSTKELVKHLEKEGVEVEDIQNSIEEDYAKILAEDFGKELVFIKKYGEDVIKEEFREYENNEKKARPPVVTVMGHVDHGKTSILDYIRNARVAGSEHGGITQHIGAYSVLTDKGEITFVDTPGHEAFTAMRTRGANITDVVILVVAANDGVMPQTEEAINHAKNAGVPIVVALNKMDLPSANPQKVKQELTKYEIVPEEWGGDHLFVECSAETGDGIKELLDMILLQAEMLDLKSIKDAPARGVVIESQKKKGKGIVASVLVRRGTLKVGDSFVVGNSYGRVRFITNDKGKRVKEIKPGKAGEITGLEEMPLAGDKLSVIKDEKVARKISEKRKYYEKRNKMIEEKENVSLEDLFAKLEGENAELALIVKGDTNGTLEAVKSSIGNIEMEEVDIKIVHSGVGMVTENDINLAITTNAIVVAFNVRIDSNARKIAEKEGIEVRNYNVIYNLLEDIQKAAVGKLEPEKVEVYIGSAEVRQIIKVPDIGNIAGSYVKDGKIIRNGIARLVREGKQIWEGSIDSLKRFKDDVREVKEGYECGIGLEDYNDIKEGDIIETYVIEERERKI
ncbi:MAG TPA: translation initiation factor IF-2, partial [Candidatus Mcinerneyibacterium sp.]|nr:translation initiation factor IF-2 [Candidatus Mcinerneyibacterium sp.]